MALKNRSKGEGALNGFVRAMLHAAAYTVLTALACGSVSAKTQKSRIKKREYFWIWLFLCVFAVSGAAIFGGSVNIGECGVAAGNFVLAAAVFIPPERGIVSDLPIPLCVFVSAAGYGINAAALAGGILGLGLAAAAELLLNNQNGERNRHKLKILACVTYIAIGMTELYII